MTPRRWARYFSDDHRQHDMAWFDGDDEEFVFEGQTWRLVALTTRQYTSTAAARLELDQLQAAKEERP
jgi:hypothetical protein